MSSTPLRIESRTGATGILPVGAPTHWGNGHLARCALPLTGATGILPVARFPCVGRTPRPADVGALEELQVVTSLPAQGSSEKSKSTKCTRHSLLSGLPTAESFVSLIIPKNQARTQGVAVRAYSLPIALSLCIKTIGHRPEHVCRVFAWRAQQDNVANRDKKKPSRSSNIMKPTDSDEYAK